MNDRDKLICAAVLAFGALWWVAGEPPPPKRNRRTSRRRPTRRRLRRNGTEIVEERSPLTYHHGYPVSRISVVDPDAPETKETYFAESTVTSMGRGGRKKTKLPGASPGVVAWLDYHLVPGRGVYIDYMRTRRDYGNRGLMKRLIEALFAKHGGEDVDFGDIVSDHVEKVWRRMRDDESLGRRIYGKIR